MIETERARMQNFDQLTRTEQCAAIKRLAADGFTDHGVSHATGLSVEQVRQILGDRGDDRGE